MTFQIFGLQVTFVK